ncbi:hypothetical protein PL11201_290006 [Planktothrix sp. PCC 11201]|uniref:hypothetical protein n=1 Tax=Planktothrix sp. PCC 11201 TaxID=1729650 RepID=UPI00091B7EFC|nr:hypothetical protein [Planktothrix sp. PCC 11201]SKB12038.1 hypothetical protein PL11201_290006 [Planktothrix sp. PCC 11201]
MNITDTDTQTLTDEQFINLLAFAFLILVNEVTDDETRNEVSSLVAEQAVHMTGNMEPEDLKLLVDAARKAFTADWYFYQNNKN